MGRGRLMLGGEHLRPVLSASSLRGVLALLPLPRSPAREGIAPLAPPHCPAGFALVAHLLEQRAEMLGPELLAAQQQLLAGVAGSRLLSQAVLG